MLLMEYGGSDRSIFIQMPSALSIPMNMPKYNWFYHTEPEPHLDGRRMHTPRGKVLGGSSSINGLVYIRGNAQDFERMERARRARLGLSRRVAVFQARRDAGRRAATNIAAKRQAQTRYGTLSNPLHAAWLAAGAQAGYPHTGDVNGFQQEGFGRMDMTVGGAALQRRHAYLRPAMQPPNLKVLTHALATRMLFEGRRAGGLEYRARRRRRIA